MKGKHDKIYIATKDRDCANTNNCDFNQLLCSPPKDGRMYRPYIAEYVVLDLLEKLKVVCGHSAMRFVQKEIEHLKK